VFPAEIVGKRIRVKLDGSQLIKVHLDKNQQTNIEHKVCKVSYRDFILTLPLILCKKIYIYTHVYIYINCVPGWGSES